MGAPQLLPPPAHRDAAPLPGYAGALATTPWGWPVLRTWCVWIEPAREAGPLEPASGAAWETVRWQQAVTAAVAAWQPVVPLRVVEEPERAQVRIWRRRPPLRSGPEGRSRASHGRALLQLVAVERQAGVWRLEPAVEVLVGAGQRQEALQATTVHELGHAFGLWGHSLNPADALAAAPGAAARLVPSAGDRATMLWLRRQPTEFGSPVAPPETAGGVPAQGGGVPAQAGGVPMQGVSR